MEVLFQKKGVQKSIKSLHLIQTNLAEEPPK